ncbi:MAG: protein kinase [Candidatus Aminicenantes bacterium]|nr:MAG: protein kinase [Candidatus Aminicenantes bacterium]
MASPGDKVKHYKILQAIGKGGMGEVFLALDTVLDRKVAIKFLPEEMQQDRTARERFVREAKSAAALDHPFICKIYETGETEGKDFIVMEYVEGVTLRGKMEEEPLHLRDSLRVGLEIAEALEKAHGSGIIHRDLKPENIMLTPQDHVKVMDFGLAKRVLPGGEEALTRTITQASLTQQGSIAGTLAYMSPEQARGETLDGRSDIFSLGVIFQEMISGQHPFSKPSAIETLSSILRDPPPSANVKPKTLNPILSPILKKALAKEPKDRYQNVVDIISDIRNAQKEIIGRPFLHRQLPIIAGTVIILALLVFGIIWITRPGAVGPSGEGPEPISVLISDFQNKTGDSVFDGALEQAFGIGLDDPLISVYDRPKARKLMKQLSPGTDDRLDIERAQLICTREGINIIVSASIEPSGDGYVIKVLAQDSVKSKKVAERTKTIETKADVLQAAHVLAAELKSDLSGIPLDSAQILEEETSTTTSLEALNAYNRAQELTAEGKKDEAIAEYLRAIEEDPNFGRAYSGLGVIYLSRGEYEKGKDYLKQALIHIDTMTEREKYRTRSIWYGLTRDYQKIIEESEALVALYPEDSAGHGNLSFAYFMIRNMPKAAEHGEIMAKLFPENVGARYNLSWYALGAGDFELAKQEASKALELDPKYERAYVTLALSELALEQSALAAKAYEQLKTLSFWGTSLGTMGLADIALYEGRLASAKKILEEGISADLESERPDLAAHKRVMLAHAYLLLGQNDHALKLADQAYAERKEIDVTVPVSQIYLQLGRVAEANSIASDLNKQLESEPRAYAKIIEGEMIKKQGDIQKAIEQFNKSQKLLDTWLVHLSLGKAFLEAEAFTKAHSELEICLRRRGEASSIFFNDNPSFYYFPQVHYYLGRILEGLGSPAAADSYQKFLQIKLKGEGDRMIEDARQRLSTL